MVVVSLLPHAEFGPNDHQDDVPHVTKNDFSLDEKLKIVKNLIFLKLKFSRANRHRRLLFVVWSITFIMAHLMVR